MQVEGADPSVQPKRLLIVANRLPVNLKKEGGKWNYSSSSGGLVAALSGLKNSDYLWIGWPGADIPQEDRETVTKELKAKGSVPVFLDEKTADEYYNGFCNGILWPLFHYLEEFHYDEKLFKAYKVANQAFADVVTKVWKKGDLIWLHDYHLMLLPGMIKTTIPDCHIGFFLHIPFPSSEIYKILPVREELLEGSLNCDLIGFHTFDYARHFMKSCTRILGLETSPQGVMYKGKNIPVGVFPVGIDPQKFRDALGTQECQDRIQELKKQFEGKKVLIGIDRLDYIKGIPQKLEGLERFFKEHPEWQGKLVLIQVAIPSRIDVPEYKNLKCEVDELVGKIDSKYSGVGSNSIHYLFKSVDHKELTALYHISDGCIITSLRDGMNLVCQEYIACQEDRNGVLILSEFAGAAGYLNGAIRVNPWNTKEVAQSIFDAITMGYEDKKQRHAKLLKFVNKHTASYWGESFVHELSKTAVALDNSKRTPSLRSIKVLNDYKNATSRLIILNYDGTLIPFYSLPGLAQPTSQALKVISGLIADPKNRVVLHSGRQKDLLESWFSKMQSLTLAAEGGAFIKPSDAEWKPLISNLDGSWRNVVRPIFTYFAERTPGSFVEEKDVQITWHYRNADPDFGASQARELQVHLDNFFAKLHINIDVQRAKKTVEVRADGVSITNFVRKILQENLGQSALTAPSPTVPRQNSEAQHSHKENSKHSTDSLHGHKGDLRQNFSDSAGSIASTSSSSMTSLSSFSGRIIVPEVENPFDFILYVGDDCALEDLVQSSANRAVYTCTVGQKVQDPRHYLKDVNEVTSFLNHLISQEDDPDFWNNQPSSADLTSQS